EAERAPAEEALSELQSAEEGVVRLAVHDVSRFEWKVSIPLPASRSLHYLIEAEIEVPSNAVARHSPWEHLQSLTRLAGATNPISSHDTTIDSLRRGAVTLTGMLAR